MEQPAAVDEMSKMGKRRRRWWRRMGQKEP